MSKNAQHVFHRREILAASVGMLGSALMGTEPMEGYPKNVNTNSHPSKLKITDLRVATIVKPGPSPCPIIRIDTDQGVYGLGEVRGRGLLLALDLRRDIASAVAASALESGLLVNAPRPGVLRFMPALTVSREEIDAMSGMLDKVLSQALIAA